MSFWKYCLAFLLNSERKTKCMYVKDCVQMRTARAAHPLTL